MAYLTNWYCLPHKIVRDMMLIISRSDVVIKITAGKLIQLSLRTFGDASIYFGGIEHFHLKTKFRYFLYSPLYFCSALIMNFPFYKKI